MLFLCLVQVYHPNFETSGILKLAVGSYFLKAHTHLKEEFFFFYSCNGKEIQVQG